MAKKARKTLPGREDPGVGFLGFTIRGTDVATFRRHILILVALSLVVKWFTILLTQNVFLSFVDVFDITYYLKYALKVLGGQIPYLQFPVDYPQGALLSILLPLLLVMITGGLPSLLAGNPTGYMLFHQALMCLFDLGTVILVYLIGLRLFGERRAFFSGILYATAFSAAYFVLTKYDSYPTFFLVLAVALFIYGRETGGYLAGAWGFLVKWFPVLALPYFLILDLKKGAAKKAVARNLGLSALLALVFTLPFFMLNPAVFIRTYTVNTGFSTLAHGFIFYLDFITRTLTGATFFPAISIALAVVAELALLALYYREPRTDHLTLCGFILFAVAAFILTNKIASPQYMQWIAPFAALFLAGSAGEALLFYAAQFWFFLEFPVLYNVIYNNIDGYLPAGAGFPAVTFLFFTVKFALIFAILWAVWRRLPAVPGVGQGPKAAPPG
ncbi:MAG TPA: hypothetical protein VMT31_01460 [Methanomicrobiales archaeon]|nr:hypothetical protein [Methanomicrobiales archaeon]